MSLGASYETTIDDRVMAIISGSFPPNGTSAVDQTGIKGQGIASVERTIAGNFLVKLEFPYPELHSVTATLQLASAANQYCQIGPSQVSDSAWVQCAFDLANEKVEKTAHGLAVGQKVKFSQDSTKVTKTWVACTGTESTNKINKSSHGLEAGEVITFRSLVGGAGITEGTRYYVISPGANDFEISLTKGGSAVNFTTDMTSGEYAKDAILPVGELAENTEYFIVAVGTNDFQVAATAGGSAITFSSGGIAAYQVVNGILIRVLSAATPQDVAANANNRVSFQLVLKATV